MLRVLWVIIALLGSGTAMAQMYSADLSSSEWTLAAGPFSCSLTHTIPKFGRAILARKAGGTDTLVVESEHGVTFPVGLSGIETLPPVWRNDIVPVGLGSFKAVQGNQPIVLAPALIPPIIKQLNAGIKVMFSSQPMSSSSAASGIVVMRVVLAAKNFAVAYKTYQQCVADLIPYTYNQVARIYINYGEKPDGLTAAHKADLNRVARYVKADPKVVAIYVDGHSDSQGTAEEREAHSKQEAEWVASYLVEQGVASNKITTRWHSDQFPIGNNNTPSGRAQNRRVTVRLEDEASLKAAEKKAAAEKVAAQADVKKAKTDNSAAQASSSSGKMTPEEISRMVEGLDLVPHK